MPSHFRQTLVAIGLILGFALLSFSTYRTGDAPDFFATWMAGKMWAAGDVGNIYPNDGAAHFRLLAPKAWYEALIPAGHEGRIYPYIYPPIWAVLSGWLTQVTDFARINAVAALLNPALMSGCLILAWRITGRVTPLLPVLIFGQVAFLATWVGQLALLQNQPQILVAFLTLLAIERARAQSPRAAGAALALAAALKLYPALFVFFFLAAGHRRASLWFVIFGGALGICSVVLAGWPLHAQFLDTVSCISATVFVTPVSFSIDPLIGQLFFLEHMPLEEKPHWAIGPNDPLPAYFGQHAMAKPALWALLSNAAIVGTVCIGCWLFYRQKEAGPNALESGWTWAFAMGLYALISPLSWCYHYIAIVAFAPQLLFLLRPRRAVLLLAGCLFPVLVPAPLFYDRLKTLLGTQIEPMQVFGTLAMGILVLSCAYTARRFSKVDHV